METKISELTDRKLLDLILSNQVAMMRLIDRIDTFLMNSNEKYADAKHLDETLKDLLESNEEFLKQVS